MALMTGTAYQPAYAAALRILPHLEEHMRTSPAPEGMSTASMPDARIVAAMLDAAFWTSLRREEGYTPRISLAYVSPDEVQSPMRLDRPIPLLPNPLTRVGPAVERPGIHLGVWPVDGELRVWGAARTLPAFCFVLETIAPGFLVVKHSRSEQSGKFVNIAVIEGDQIKVVDQRTPAVTDYPALLTSLLGLEAQFTVASSANVLIQLAISMRAHGRGGSLLVVPSESDGWQRSILSPINYRMVPQFSGLTELMQADLEERPRNRWREALRRSVDSIAGLTAVDGAAIISDQYHLLAFGAKIVRRAGAPQVSRVMVTEPIEGIDPVVLEPAQIGGTRHLSAAQFVHDQRDSIALVASQDGHFTVFAWSPRDEMVQALRIEYLLL